MGTASAGQWATPSFQCKVLVHTLLSGNRSSVDSVLQARPPLPVTLRLAHPRGDSVTQQVCWQHGDGVCSMRHGGALPGHALPEPVLVVI